MDDKEYLQIQTKIAEVDDKFLLVGRPRIFVTGMLAGGIFLVPAVIGLFLKTEEYTGWGKYRWLFFFVGFFMMVLNLVFLLLSKRRRIQLEQEKEDLQRQLENYEVENK